MVQHRQLYNELGIKRGIDASRNAAREFVPFVACEQISCPNCVRLPLGRVEFVDAPASRRFLLLPARPHGR